MNIKPKYPVKYIAGASAIQKPTDSYVLSMETSGIKLWRLWSPTVEIDWKDIYKISAESQSSIGKTILSTASGAAAGMLLLGPLGAIIGAGMGARTDGSESFLSIVYDDEGIENVLVLQSKKAHEIAGTLNSERSQYLKLNKLPIRENKKTVQSETSLDELEKLAKLKDKNIITQEEFDQKKKQLLGL